VCESPGVAGILDFICRPECQERVELRRSRRPSRRSPC
jgi:hypothetical protein